MFSLAELFSNLIGLGKSLIEDKEKQAEFAYKIAELQVQVQEKILTMTTTPRMDAFVKFLYALKELILPLMRPMVSTCLSGFAAYAAYKHIDLGPLNVVFGAAFPGWMASRGIEKLTDKD